MTDKKKPDVQIIDIGSTHKRLPRPTAPRREPPVDPEIAKWMQVELDKKRKRETN